MYFWIDEENGLKKTYEDVILDLNTKKSVLKFIRFSNPYDTLIELIASLIYGLKVDIIDDDLSVEELNHMGIKEEDLSLHYRIETMFFHSINEIINEIPKNELWGLSIYTSGTTGRPKKVQHTFQSITRAVHLGERYKDNIWAFAFNISHFAGLQVFFQAFLNQNTIVYVFKSKRDYFGSLIRKYSCTHISATPTFYRNVIPCIKEPVVSIRSLTLGGERFDTTLVQKLNILFPNGKIHNIYASTEAGSLFIGTGDAFEIPKGMELLFKISEKNELLLHKSLLEHIETKDDWYNTHDIVEIIADGKIRIVSRTTDMINVGGYKVNPLEVEEEIKKIDGIIDVVIKSRTNKILGNLLEAEIIKNDDISEIEMKKKIVEALNRTLQKWKIPRMLNFVERISETKTGKKMR